MLLIRVDRALANNVCILANNVLLNPHAFHAFKDIYIKINVFLNVQLDIILIILIINAQFAVLFIPIAMNASRQNVLFVQPIIYYTAEVVYQVAPLIIINKIKHAINVLLLVCNVLHI